MSESLSSHRVSRSDYSPLTDCVVFEAAGQNRVFRAGWSWRSMVSLGHRFDLFSVLGLARVLAWYAFLVFLAGSLLRDYPLQGIVAVSLALGLMAYFGKTGEERFIRMQMDHGAWCVVCRGLTDAQALEVAELSGGNAPAHPPREMFDPPPSRPPVDQPDASDDEAGFGYKMAWLAIAPGEGKVSLAGIYAGQPRAVSLRSAIKDVYQDVRSVALIQLVSGWTLVVGFSIAECLESRSSLQSHPQLQALLSRHGNLQVFGTHRVSETHGWAKFQKGVLVRYVFASDGQFDSLGEPSDLEKRLIQEHGYGSGEDSQEESTDEADFEGFSEEVVVKLAAAWGVDPLAIRPSHTRLVTLWRA